MARKMFRPMTSTNVGVQLDRTYHASGQFQWARETLVNAKEAGATRVEFGIEWQAVERKGVYRRMIADNGKGMTPDELEKFFNEYGGGGKTIGPLLENFGVGAKTSLLPWNRYGVVVISWVGGEPSMIWIEHDPETNEYGLKLEEVELGDGSIGYEAVVNPYDDPDHGVDWEKIKPDWIAESGTVIVLLGDDPETDTVNGDPNRDESGTKTLAGYLNRRFWKLNGGRMSVSVIELGSVKKDAWPNSKPRAYSVTAGANSRPVKGAHSWITEPAYRGEAQATLKSGTVELDDGIAVDWYLWHGRPRMWQYSGVQKGFIAVHHRDELYNVTSELASYRTFRISEKEVRDSLWLIVRAPDHDPSTKKGVFPTIDRNQLLWGTGERLPFNSWGQQFSDLLPDEILRALRAVRRDELNSIEDEAWRKRLMQKLASRRAFAKFRHDAESADSAGELTHFAQERKRREEPTPPRPPRPDGTKRKRSRKRGKLNVASIGSIHAAREAKLTGDLPRCRKTTDPEAIEQGMIAAYQGSSADCPGGLVTFYVAHPLIEQEIGYWQSLYSDHQADDVRKEVIEAYSEVLIARIAHSEDMRAFIDGKMVDDDTVGMRSPAALSLSLLGMIAEEALIGPRLAQRIGRRRKSGTAFSFQKCLTSEVTSEVVNIGT